MNLWNRSAITLWLLALSLVAGTPASAQYMFLDTDGDGAPSAADKLNENCAPTTVDVYLFTDSDRLGNPRICDEDNTRPITVNSYVVGLRATGGTVLFGRFTNADPASFPTMIAPERSSPTEWQRGQGGGTSLLPTSEIGSAYKLMTLTVTVASGHPDLQIVPLTGLSSIQTSFGTLCPGISGDNAYKLGSDWFDVSGAAASDVENGLTLPTISAPSTVSGTETDSLITIRASASDPDNDPLTLRQVRSGAPATFLTGPSSVGPIVNPIITLSGKPTFTSSGTTTFTWTADDGIACIVGAATVMTITNVNRAPVIVAPASRSVVALTNLIFTVGASDPDGQAIASFTQSTMPTPSPAVFFTTSAPTGNRGGTYAWTPSSTSAGNYTATFTATSSSPTSSGSASTAITVLDLTYPVVTAMTMAFVNENSLLTVTVSATDADGPAIESLTASGTAITAGATFAAGAGNTSGTLSWTPTFTQAGSYGATFTAANALSSSASTAITVGNVDRAPTVTAPGAVFVNENSLLTVEVVAVDADGQAITLLTAGGPAVIAGATFVPGTENTSGTLSWTPTFTQAGSYAVNFTAKNVLSGSATTTIAVNNTDRAPVVWVPASRTLNEGGTVTFTVGATDPDQDAIASLAASLPAGALFTPNAMNASGVFSWTPGFTQAGTYVVTFTAQNGLSGSGNTAISVVDVNDPPTLMAPASVTGTEGAPVMFTVSASDRDGDPLTSLAAGPLPTGATFNVASSNAAGTFTWTPDFTQDGEYSVTISAESARRALGVSGPVIYMSSEMDVSILVTDADRPPVITAPGAQATTEGALLSFSVTAADPDGQPIGSLTASSLPDGATFAPSPSMAVGDFSWTPGFAQAGNYYVQFSASNALASTATVPIYVSNVNQAAVIIAPASLFAFEGSSVEFSATTADPDGDLTHLGVLDLPVGATFVDSGTGSGIFSWVPGYGQSGTHQVTFTAVDALGLAATPRQVAIIVGNVNRAPSADPQGPYAGAVNVPITFDATPSSDPDGDALSHTWDFGDGSFGAGPLSQHAYTAGGGFVVTLTVSDGSLSNSASTAATIQDIFPAQAFTSGGNSTIRLGSARATWCAQVEPLGNSFLNSSVVFNSIRMRYGTEQVLALEGKVGIGGDEDGNGIQELAVCFGKTDLRTLFASLPKGANAVTVDLEADLRTGGRFRANLTVPVVSSGGDLVASLSPNPLNPEGTLTIKTAREGLLRVTLFDLAGRVIRVLYDSPSSVAGYHDVRIDGRDNAGQRLASGMYFFRVEAAEGMETGRLLITR